MADVMLKQCELKRVRGTMVETVVCWLEASGLQERWRVKLDGVDNDWWTVHKIYDHGMLKAELHTDRESKIIHEKDHRRKMTGLKLGEVN
jgi:hypothetical protein